MRKKNRQKQIRKRQHRLEPKITVSSLYFAGLIVLIFASVIAAISSSANAVELVAIETEIEEIKMKNREIQSSIVEETSLTDVAETARELGLTERENIVTLVTQPSVASR